MLLINVSYVMWTLPPVRRRHARIDHPAPRQVGFHRAFTLSECFPSAGNLVRAIDEADLRRRGRMLAVSLFKTLYFCNSGFISAIPKDT
jgi:hypothetical protein